MFTNYNGNVKIETPEDLESSGIFIFTLSEF